MSQEDMVERRIKEVFDNRSPNLYLNRCNLIQIPEEVFKLKHLQHLDLRNNRIVYLPGDIEKLENLKGLYLNNNRLRELPDEITHLKKLQVLKADDNRLKYLPDNLSQLENLRYLYSNGNHLKRLPPKLMRLTHLKVLNLGHNRLETLPDEINLDNLEVLNLENNRINCIPAEIARLTKLQLLYLSRNWLTELPFEIFQLTQLIRLDLNFNRIKELPDDISLLMSLRVLNIEGNRLDRLNPELFQLESLGVLNADGNRIKQLPPEIFRLKKLEYLSLSRNSLKRLPPQISRLKHLVYSGIDQNPLENPPIEIAKRGVDSIRSYFKQIKEQGEDCLYEGDLIILGQSDTGKSSLCKKLLDPDCRLDGHSTPAPTFEPSSLLAPKPAKEDVPAPEPDAMTYAWEFPFSPEITFRTNIKDLSGAETLRALHHRFITKRSVCAIVIDNREDVRDFYYWFDFIKLLLKVKHPVIIVFNRKFPGREKFPVEVWESFPGSLPVFTVDLSDNSGLDELREAIMKEMKALPHVGREPLPKQWVALRRQLASLSQPHTTGPHFLDMCKLHGIEDKNNAYCLSDYLHDLGIIFHVNRDKTLRKTVFLDPGWYCTALTLVLTDDMVKKEKGEVDIPELRRIWEAPAYANMHSSLLGLLIHLELCYETGSRQYIIPQQLPADSPGISQFNTLDERPMLFRYHYPFMPYGLLTRLMSRMNSYIYAKMQWRNGVMLQIGDAGVEIMENHYNREIRIAIVGESRAEALDIVRKEFKAMHEGFLHLKVDEIIPCNCSHCIDLMEPQFYSYQLLKEYRALGRYKVVCEKSFEDAVIHSLIREVSSTILFEQQPTQYKRILRSDEDDVELLKRRNKLFIGFSRSDRQWWDRLHIHLKEFEDEGFELEVWDDEQLSAGKKWERLIEETFTEVKVVILLISADFLASDFIVNNELPPLLEASEREGTVILPLILKPCRFSKNPNISQFPAVIDASQPLIDLTESGQEEVFVKLTETIDENLRDINPTLTR